MAARRPRDVTTRPDDDFGLVAATRAGDDKAFGVLVQRYQDRLHATLHRLVGCPEDARDLVQDAFMRAYEKLGKFHGESGFYTWIYRIAVNLTLSDRRKRRAPIRVSLSRSDHVDPADDSGAGDPARPLERAEQDALVHAALMELPKDHRLVVVMKDQDGLRYEEIAKILDIPIGTVRSRLHRARVELRDRLRHVLDMQPAGSPSELESLSS